MSKIIGIVGGGPSGLFMYKRIIESEAKDLIVHIFESHVALGKGMPYSNEGANVEHVTNVSGNEIPALVTPILEWIKTLPGKKLQEFSIEKEKINDYKVLPRLLFGEYLKAQFDLLKVQGTFLNIETHVHLSTTVTDITEDGTTGKIKVQIAYGEAYQCDQVIICTGHSWPKTCEGKVEGYFDSPYPPAKIAKVFAHPIAIRGSSLTAIDAIRTLARQHGRFVTTGKNRVAYVENERAGDFKIILHSRHGLLPGIRFHLEDPHLSKKGLMSKTDIKKAIVLNGGFLSLDLLFEKDFKNSFKEKDPVFFEIIKKQTLEEFVEMMMGLREMIEPFQLFKKEYEEAQVSIQTKRSVYWKEMLAVLSFAMNYPAKYFSAEDMLRLQKVLMPLISIVIAFVPQSSCEELIALHDAGKLEIISVGNDNTVEVNDDEIIFHHTDATGEKISTSYQTFIDCIGQRHLSMDEFPFQSLVNDGTISPAKLKFADAQQAVSLLESGSDNIFKDDAENYFLKVPGIAIDDNFRVIGESNIANPRIHIMAVSYIGGFNPDYSGLDFCEEASKVIMEDMGLFKD